MNSDTLLQSSHFSRNGKQIVRLLKKAGIKTIAELASIHDEDLLAIRNFGQSYLKEVRATAPYLVQEQSSSKHAARLRWLRSLSPKYVDASIDLFPDLFEVNGARIANILIRNGFKHVATIAKCSDEDLLECRELGKTSLAIIRKAIPCEPGFTSNPEKLRIKQGVELWSSK